MMRDMALPAVLRDALIERMQRAGGDVHCVIHVTTRIPIAEAAK